MLLLREPLDVSVQQNSLSMPATMIWLNDDNALGC